MTVPPWLYHCDCSSGVSSDLRLASAAALESSCPSLTRFGEYQTNAGSVPAARSAAYCDPGTTLGPFVPGKNANGLCFFTYRPACTPVYAASGMSSMYAFHG